MPTIAELTLKLDARPIEQGTSAMNDFANAAERAKKATDGFNGKPTNVVPPGESDKVKDLSAAIDAQTRKLQNLADQRKALESSGMKNTAPQEYERLNKIIDANIGLVNRQGNAVELLDEKRHRAAQKVEATAAAELRAQERVTEATVRQENIVSAATARQQRQIDQTIAGLSRQIKAQQEYNNTIETLNRARATSGMAGDPTMSGAEYDSYVKLAEAKRDAAFATEDNSRAIMAAQSRLDTFTSTLGKAERAEVQFGRAVQILDKNLELGNITIQEYNEKLSRFADHRDKAVRAANDNTAAEQRFERELRNVVAAYDPVLQAQNQYNASVRILADGLQNGVLSVEQFNKALREQVTALDNVKNANSSMARISKDYEDALDAAVPYRTELRNLELQQRKLDEAHKAGLVNTPAQIDSYNKATESIKRNREELQKRIKDGQNAGITYKQEQAALRGMPAQITDIVVSLQGGQAPLTVLLQQGGQIKDMFGGIMPAISGLARGIYALITPLSVALTAFATLGAAAYSGSQEVTEFNRALIQSGNVSGVTASEFTAMQTSLDSTITTSGKAAEVLTLMAGSGKIAGEAFEQVAAASILFSKATGESVDKIVEDFSALGKDPVDSAVRLDEKYRFLTSAVLAQADALVKQGQEQEAILLLQTSMSEAANETATKMIEEAGYIEKAWSGVKKIITETWDALKNIGREDTTQSRIDALKEVQQNIIDYKGAEAAARDSRYKDAESEIRILEQRRTFEKSVAEQRKTDERTRQESVSATASALKRYTNGLEGVAKAENDLKIVRQENEKIRAAGNVSTELAATMAANEAKAVKDLADAKEKANKPGRAGALDTSNVQEVRSSLTAINAEYDGYYKRVTALGEANVVSAEATYHSQQSILKAQAKAVSESYDEQIKAIKELQGNKKNSAAQNISLENQLTKAEAARTVALEKNQTKQEELTIKFQADMKKRELAISSYKAALDQQTEDLANQGQRAVEGVGRGDRQNAVAQQLNDNDRNFTKQQRKLSQSLSEGMDPTEYAEKLKLLEKSHSDMAKQIIQNDKDIQAANYDWTNGFTSALENAQDDAMNFAGTVESMLTGAFNSAGRALGDFVTTGKLNFKDFASSVIADMARIAAQQAASGLLSSLLGIGAAAAGAWFSAPASMGSTAAGYSPEIMNAWSAGQAQGGAWNGGTQYFAQGGMFTNSVVSNPTPFGMSNGAKGVMGEAGPEAIVPLARTRNGDLGVRMMGDAGGGGTVVNVVVNVTESGSSSSTNGGPDMEAFGNNLGSFVRQEIYTVINKETRPGGSIQAQE